MFNKDPDRGERDIRAYVFRFRQSLQPGVYAKKNTSIPNSLCRVHNRQVLRAVSPGNVIVVGEGRCWGFFGGTPAFLSSSAVERVARKRRRGRQGREGEREMQSERGGIETRRKLLRRVGNWPKVCKSETGGTRIDNKGVGGTFVAKKKRQASHIGIVFAFHQWTSGTDPM